MKKAFTLIELIGAITILMILSTIAYMTFQDGIKKSPENKQKIESDCKMSGKAMFDVYREQKCMTQFDYCNRVSDDSEALKICMEQKF